MSIYMILYIIIMLLAKYDVLSFSLMPILIFKTSKQ